MRHILEDEFELVLANAAHIRNVPGRTTDVNDAMWIADRLAHGLIRSSLVPPAAIQELRDLTRTRKPIVRSSCASRRAAGPALALTSGDLGRRQLMVDPAGV